MEGITNNLIKQIGKYYTLGEREEKGLDSVVHNWAYETREENTLRLQQILSRAPIIKLDQKSSAMRKLEEFAPILADVKPSSILDFGAGTGDLLTALSEKYLLTREKVYAIEPKSLNSSSSFTTIDSTVDLEDDSIDLIIISEVLHHIHPRKRSKILIDLRRILSPIGKIIVREHAYNQTPAMYIGLDIYHNMWYIRGNEEYDPLYLILEADLSNQMSTAGLTMEFKTEPRGWQQIYIAVFRKPTKI